MAIPQREDGDFIEGIYNWCDRWCLRCPLTTKCRQYAMECARDAFNADGSNDGDSAEFVESLICVAGEFENAAENETDGEIDAGFEDADTEPESYDSTTDFDEFDMEAYMAERDRIDRATSENACVKTADRYLAESGRWLDEWDILVEDLIRKNEEILDAEEVVRWYQMQIPIKLRRAISGKLDDEFDFMEDVFGSAKVALLGADSSLEAWAKIREALPVKNRNSVDPLIGLLKQLVEETETEIPEARHFQRPGFDD